MEFEAFRGKDVNEVMAAVKAAFGPDAWIGSTRHLSNGKSGGFGREAVEVRAAPAMKQGEDGRVQPRGALDSLRAAGEARALVPVGEAASAARGGIATRLRNTGFRDEPMGGVSNTQLLEIQAMLRELQASRSPKDRASGMLHAGRLDGPLAARLARGCASAARRGERELRAHLRQKLRKEIRVLSSPLEEAGRRFILCVGATGVGKTTTIAKLAARARLELGRRASIVTFDTYRVGSVEQLSRFAQLIGIPFEVAHDTASFCDALLAHPSELVFIDTASLPPSQHAWSRKVTDCLASAPDVPVDVLLVVPSMMSGEDAERLVSIYRAPAVTGMVITKLDESSRAGGAVQAAVNSALPIGYLCWGPRVPEDLTTPTVDEVLDLVLPERP